MNSQDERPPCINGCTKTVAPAEEGGDPQKRPLLAVYGRYCRRCFHRTDDALLTAGTLTNHIVEHIGGLHAKVRDADEPLIRSKARSTITADDRAMDDANQMYRALVYWASVWATRLNRLIPGPARRAWHRNSHSVGSRLENSVIGLPADISPTAAHQAVGTIAKWLSLNLSDIFRHPDTADVDEFRAAVDEIYRLRAKWPMEDRPRYVPAISCWVDVEGGGRCGERIGMFPPKFAGADRLIRCDRGHVFHEDEFDRMSGLFRQVRKEQAKESAAEHRKAARVAASLTKKYGAQSAS